MADRSTIEWTDATWNPVTGCTEVSPGCDRCYAKTFAERWRGTPGHHFERGFDITPRPERLGQPLRWGKSRRVFVNSMSDMFHEQIPDEYIAEVFAVMARAPQHTFQLLTKRHGRMRSLLASDSFPELVSLAGFASPDGIAAWPLPNVWLGVSVENQQWANIRIPALLRTPAAVRFLSCEPLLGPVTLNRLHAHCPTHDFAGGFCSGPCPDIIYPEWIIVGGESGHGARPMHPDWGRALRDQAVGLRIPFFFKQWGRWGPEIPVSATARSTSIAMADDGTVYKPEDLADPDGASYGEALRARHDKAHLTMLYATGKGISGRDLDGRTWDELPAITKEAAA